MKKSFFIFVTLGHFLLTPFAQASLSRSLLRFSRPLSKLPLYGPHLLEGKHSLKAWVPQKMPFQAIGHGREGFHILLDTDGSGDVQRYFPLDSLLAVGNLVPPNHPAIGAAKKEAHERGLDFFPSTIITPEEALFSERLGRTTGMKDFKVWLGKGGSSTIALSPDVIIRGMQSRGLLTPNPNLKPWQIQYIIGVTEDIAYHGSESLSWRLCNDRRLAQRFAWEGEAPIGRLISKIEKDDLTGNLALARTIQAIKERNANPHLGKVVAVVLTPSPGTNGLRKNPHGYLKKQVAAFKELGLKIILDLVYVGMGAAGQGDDFQEGDPIHYWAHQVQGVDSNDVDAIVMAKSAFGGAFPGSAVIFNANTDWMQAFEDEPLARGDTYRAVPEQSMIGNRVLDFVEERDHALFRNAHRLGLLMDREMQDFASENSMIEEWRPNGTIGNLILKHPHTGESLKPEDVKIGRKVFMKRGLLPFFGPNDNMTFALPFSLDEAEAKKIFERVGSALKDFETELKLGAFQPEDAS